MMPPRRQLIEAPGPMGPLGQAHAGSATDLGALYQVHLSTTTEWSIRGAMRSLFRWLAPKPALPAPTEELGSTADLGDELKKLARAHGRSALRVEEVERKIDALGVALATLTARVTAPTPPTQTDDDITSVFDAMDTLDEAVRSVPADAPALAAGLVGVLTRLDRFIAARGYTRVAALGQPPDGALVRVVGVEVASGVADGAVTRVVRAPIRRGDRVVRLGEVITKQKEAP